VVVNSGSNQSSLLSLLLPPEEENVKLLPYYLFTYMYKASGKENDTRVQETVTERRMTNVEINVE
jgi:hypothetical protein